MRQMLLRIEDLNVQSADGTRLLDGIDLEVSAGEPLVIIGETGSGKSLIAQALFGLLPRSLSVSGRLHVDGIEVDLARTGELRQFWGSRMFLLPQEPRLALDPTMRIVRQVCEAGPAGSGDADHVLGKVGLPQGVASHFPHMMSGGMAQRALIACGLQQRASLLVADEPTKGLDSFRAQRIAETLASLASGDRSLIVITHDLDILRKFSGSIAVLRDGRIVERGAIHEVMDQPAHAYTRAWLEADPERWSRRTGEQISRPTVVSAHDIAFGFSARRPLFENMTLDIAAGEMVGLMGPSGCGKSTLGNILLGLRRPDRGSIFWAGQRLWKGRRVARRLRQRHQKLHQDPASAFVPNRTFRMQFGDLAEVLPGWSMDVVLPLIERMQIRETLLDRFPNEVSGGESQRLAIARVLALKPDFIVADEPTSRLDPIIQKGVIELLREVCDERGIGVLLIGHNDTMLRSVADRVIALPNAVNG